MYYCRIGFIIGIIVLLCAPVQGENRVYLNDKKVDIVGKITSLAKRDDRQIPLVIRVEGENLKTTNYDKASVKVTLDTLVKDKRTGKILNSQYSSLKLGQEVEATFIGPVAESYPVQATAKEVVILSD